MHFQNEIHDTTGCHTHHESHRVHFVSKAAHHRVLWQTLLQLIDVFVKVHDL